MAEMEDYSRVWNYEGDVLDNFTVQSANSTNLAFNLMNPESPSTSFQPPEPLQLHQMEVQMQIQQPQQIPFSLAPQLPPATFPINNNNYSNSMSEPPPPPAPSVLQIPQMQQSTTPGIAQVLGRSRTSPSTDRTNSGNSSSSGGEGSGGIIVESPSTTATTNSIQNQSSSLKQQTTAATTTKVPRKKLWKCVYPGCNEPSKTHYNAHSHVWDAHVRHELGPNNPLCSIVYKKLPDRDSVKKLCQKYMTELPDSAGRAAKRRKKRSDDQGSSNGSSSTPILALNSLQLQQQMQGVAEGTSPETQIQVQLAMQMTEIPQQQPSVIVQPKIEEEEGEGIPIVSIPQEQQQQQIQVQQGQEEEIYVFNPNVETAADQADDEESPDSDSAINSILKTSPPSTTATTKPNEIATKQQQQQQQRVVTISPTLNPVVITPTQINVIPPVSDPSSPQSTASSSQSPSPQTTIATSQIQIQPQQKQQVNTTTSSSSSNISTNSVAVTVSNGQINSNNTVGVKVDNPDYQAPDTNEFVRIVTLEPGLKRLHVCGEVFAERGFLQRSDARFKEEIRPIRGALERVLNICGRTFKYIGDDRTRMGFVAQELQQVVPTAVLRDERGLSVDVVSLIPLILEALKDLHSQTSGLQSNQAQQFQLALDEAMERVKELDSKLSCLRNDENSDSSNTSSISDNSENESETDGDLYINEEIPTKKKKTPHHKLITKHPEFHYEFTFGPIPIVVFFALIFLGAGITTFFLLPKLPFVWSFCWFTTAVLGISVIFKWRELFQVIKSFGGDLQLDWNPANTINVFVLASIAIIGATLTLIVGKVALFSVAVFGTVLIVVWGFSIVIHHKYAVRINTILVAFLGFLTLSSFIFAMLFMIQPYQCTFSGYSSTSRVELEVRVGQTITPLELESIPFNCFFYILNATGEFPPGIILNTNTTPPAITGNIHSLFNTTSSEITLICSGYQKHSCGEVIFSACSDMADENMCRENSCSWCPFSYTNSTGTCGRCTQEFEDACYSKTSLHSSCYGQIKKSFSALNIPSFSLLLVASFILLLLNS